MGKSVDEAADPVEILLRTDLFRELDRHQCEQVSKLIKWRGYRKNTEVVHYLGRDDDVYFIAAGRVRVTIFSVEGKEISYQELGAGEMFGELSAIDGLPRTANVIALEDSRFGLLGRAAFWELLQQYPVLASGIMKRLAGLVRFLTDRVYQYGALDVNDRVRMEILRLARQNLIDDNSASIEDFPTHREIANRVNTHREAVTKVLNELKRRGVIRQDKRVLTVADLSSLARLLPE
jgi:CRP/FNR family transcriptional regulator, cyclic AMP receptor protein